MNACPIRGQGSNLRWATDVVFFCGGLGRPVYLGSNMLVGKGSGRVLVCSWIRFFSFLDVKDPLSMHAILNSRVIIHI